MARSLLEDDEPLILEATAAMLEELDPNRCEAARLSKASHGNHR
jgi:hypothetical protein